MGVYFISPSFERDASPSQDYRPVLNSPVTINYTYVERGIVRVKCLGQERVPESSASPQSFVIILFRPIRGANFSYCYYHLVETAL